MIELRWLVQSDGSDVKKLQFRQWLHHYWSEWTDVPTVLHVPGDTVRSPTQSKEQHND